MTWACTGRMKEGVNRLPVMTLGASGKADATAGIHGQGRENYFSGGAPRDQHPHKSA